MPPGMDVVAAESVTLAPGARHAVATGFAIAIPEGYEVQVRPRSGLALKHGITCLNTPGTIDADYRGEVKVILANLGDGDFEVVRGERIAQLVPAPVVTRPLRRGGDARRDGSRRRRLRIDREVMMKHLLAASLLLAAASGRGADRRNRKRRLEQHSRDAASRSAPRSMPTRSRPSPR